MKLIDLTGKEFGSLRVIEKAKPEEIEKPPKNKTSIWKCFCKRCESITYCSSNNLLHQGNRYCQKCKKRIFSKEEELKILKELPYSTISNIARRYNCSRGVIYGIIDRYKNSKD